MTLDKARLDEWKRLAESWANTGQPAAGEMVSSLIAEAEWLEVLCGMLNDLANANAELVRRRDETLDRERAELRQAKAEVAHLRHLVSMAAPLDWLARHDRAAAQDSEGRGRSAEVRRSPVAPRAMQACRGGAVEEADSDDGAGLFQEWTRS